MLNLVFAALLAYASLAVAQGGDGRSRLDRAYDEWVAAESALRRAQTVRDSGAEPLPGERQGLAGGGSRLAPAYWERQDRIEKAVAAARMRRDEALDRWNSLR